MCDEVALRSESTAAAFALAASLVASLDVDQTCWRLAVEARAALEPASCLVLEYDPASHALVATAGSGDDVRALVGRRLPMVAGGPPVEALSHLETDLCALASDDPAVEDLRDLLGRRAFLARPLVIQSELIGLLLVVAHRSVDGWSTAAIALVDQLAMVAAPALHNARLFRNAKRGQGRLEGILTRMSQVREHERKAFAALVHDDILQSMAGAVYALDALRDSVAQAALGDFDHVVRMLRLSVEDARKIIWELRPSVLDGLGLSEALGALADRVAVDGHAEVHTRIRDVGEVGEAVSTAVYKIGREALLNAERHAQAERFDLGLARHEAADGPVLVLTVSDDGVGFDPSADRSPGHYGLVMMEEQAAAVGGELHVESSPGGGTTVSLDLPLVTLSREGGTS